MVREYRHKNKEGTGNPHGLSVVDNELRQRSFIDNNVDGAWRFDLEQPIPLSLPAREQVELLYRLGYFGEANQALADQYGFDTPEEIIGFRLRQFMPPDRADSIPALVKVVASNYRINDWVSIEQDRFGNRKVFLNNLEGEVKDGCLLRVWGTAKDITRQEELEELARLHSEVLEQSSDGCVVVAMPSEAVVYVNPAFTRLTGYTAADLTAVKLSVLEGVDTDPNTLSALREAIAQSQCFVGEILNYRKDGTPFWNLMKICPIKDAQGSATHYVGILSDVTELKSVWKHVQELRDQLAHVTRVSTLQQLTATLAHEMNQPLSAILSNAQAALRFLDWDEPDLDEVRYALRAIVADDKRAGEVVRRVRGLVKPQQTCFERLDVNRIIEAVQALVINDMMLRRTTITCQMQPDLSAVVGDAIQLQQVFLNLVMNACQAQQEMAAGERRIMISSQRRDERSIEISVADAGPGIDDALREKIFQPFFSDKEGGLGMGLAIGRSIVEAHGGRLWAENGPERGAVFHITLPVAP